MNQSSLKHIVLNLAVAAIAVAAFTAAPISGEALFSLVIAAAVTGIALNDYRTRRPLQLRLRARPVAVASRRRVAALVAA